MVKRKTRTICFRVSEEDYQALQVYRAANGGRSISELARGAMQQFLTNGAPKLEGLSERLSAVERAVERLARLMEAG